MNEHEHGSRAGDTPAPELYLWSGTGVADPEIARLEGVLGTLRYKGARPLVPAPSRTAPRRALAIAAAVTIGACAAWFAFERPPRIAEGWAVAPTAGIVTIDAVPLSTPSRLPVGRWLETDARARVDLDVANIGSLTVHPDSRLRITATRIGDEHRVELAHGRIEAFIFAPPRLFFVDTPAAVAVDLGCIYELEVDRHGTGELFVSLGWVMLEAGTYSVTVPTDARCPIHATRGPGTPHFDDAPPALVDALAALDAGELEEAALDVVITHARPRDRLSLWHLLPRVDPGRRSRVVAAMTAFAPLPAHVSADAVMTLDAKALEAWWIELDRAW